MRPALASSLLLALAAPAAASAQTLVQQEQRLMELHGLLFDLPPVQAPAALGSGALDASLEAVTIPFIDGNAGPRHEITASDHTRIFPRPRLALGLPAPAGARAFVGLSYIPPVEFRQVSTSYVAAEGGVGLAPGRWRLGLRAHGVYADTRAPVTEPSTRDRLQTWLYGADLSGGVQLGTPAAQLEPYAGVGVVTLRGRFRVKVDATVLRRTYGTPILLAGVRFLWRSRWEAVAELDAYPGRLTHVDFRVGYLFGG